MKVGRPHSKSWSRSNAKEKGLDLDRIERLAAVSDRGDWIPCTITRVEQETPSSPDRKVQTWMGTGPVHEGKGAVGFACDDSTFISEMSPKTALRIIAEVRKLRKKVGKNANRNASSKK